MGVVGISPVGVQRLYTKKPGLSISKKKEMGV